MFAKILGVCKWIAGVAAGVAVVISIVSFIYSQGRKTEQKRFEETTMVVKVNKSLYNDSIMKLQLNEIITNQMIFQEGQETFSIKFDKLNTSHITLLKELGKVDLLLQLYEDEKKNEEITSWQIPLRPSN